jgi:Site-specific recombinases, DNA invertase Pin homologs
VRYAIYSRKSKFTGKGQSVANQVQICREYIQFLYRDDEEMQIEVFEDEGYSGKNTNRPEFRKMMAGVAQKQFDVVACYRLDRISRSVSDFSATYMQFRKYGVVLLLASERFDTSSSYGEFMLHISSAFAQMERDLIAERIRDNMLMLARSGCWLGGATPLGFRSEETRKELADGREKSTFWLQAVPEELAVVRGLFDKYLQTQSLTQVEAWCQSRDIRTRKGNVFSAVAVREILANPVYCVADQDAYAWFFQKGCALCGELREFDTKRGISAYNRTAGEGGRQKKRPLTEWVVAVGRHQGAVPGNDWVRTQQLLERGQQRAFAYRPQNPAALLGGLFYCGRCGATMRPRVNSNKRASPNAERTFAYICERKRKSKKAQCQCPNISGNDLDKAIWEQLFDFWENPAGIAACLMRCRPELERGGAQKKAERRRICRQVEGIEKEIKNLIALLAQTNADSALRVHTEQLVKEKDAQMQKCRQVLREMAPPAEAAKEDWAKAEHLAGELRRFAGVFYNAPVPDKRELLRAVIDRVEWDGCRVDIYLAAGLSGEKALESV